MLWFITASVSAFLDDNAGLMLVGASQFFLSAMYVSVKILNSLDKPVPTLELIWVRMVFTYICSIAYMYWRKIPDPLLGPKGLRLLLVLRALWGVFFGLSGMYFSLQHLSLSDAMVLSYLAPILTGFSGAIFLKESLSLKDVLAGCAIILISRPRFLFGGLHLIRSVDNIPADQSEIATPEQRMLSIIAALIGVLGATGAYTCLRAIGKRAHTIHSLTFFSSQCILASTIGMIIFKIPPVIPMRVSWIAMLLLIGIFGFIAQILLTMGFQRETAARGTLALYTGACLLPYTVVFALAFERTIFHTSPSSFSIAGTAVIIGSAIYTTVLFSKSHCFSSHLIPL
ncbi:hypothetical protein B0F90DRAFT_1629305 [Multifurca ochricompacta]|uniref:EamA domain-containing protein n=1 Tax=Multifurca ochricompacta TaxID=376703 RepID=A0AAD4M3H2_9AGAM|nr:hypothetical protein B0F90DRAFT_1629305 [Multifurca ochricompacta]